MPESSPQLFRAWAARHRHVVELEDRLKSAQDTGSGDVAALTQELEEARAAAAEALRQATTAFHAELRERGLE